MTSSNDISNVATKVVNARNAIANKYDIYLNTAVLNYCKGDIANNFKNANSRVKSKMNTLLSNYNTLNSKLISLSNAVKNAEAAKPVGGKRY